LGAKRDNSRPFPFTGQDTLVNFFCTYAYILLLQRTCYHHVIIKIIHSVAYMKCMIAWIVIFSNISWEWATKFRS